MRWRKEQDMSQFMLIPYQINTNDIYIIRIQSFRSLKSNQSMSMVQKIIIHIEQRF